MEKFYLERPSFERKDEIIEYINEFVEYNSEINKVLLIKSSKSIKSNSSSCFW